MKLFRRKLTPEQEEAIRTKDFFDRVTPGIIQFFTDHYVFGDFFCCVWAIREYPPTTETQALLGHLAERKGVTLHLYHRPVERLEADRILNEARRKNTLMAGDNSITKSIEAQSNLQNMESMINEMWQTREHLLYCGAYIELRASTMEELRRFQEDIKAELAKAKITVDRLTLQQKEGFLTVSPFGVPQIGSQFERVLPASAVANLFPLSSSGKIDPEGFYIGKDKFGSNILVDLDRRTPDKTNGNCLILGNSGEGKSFLLKLLLMNLRQSGKSVICLDAEGEYEVLAEKLGGSYVDYMSGAYMINVLEPKQWTEEDGEKVGTLSRHIAFLKDFFKSYKEFSDGHTDVLEIMLGKLYKIFEISDSTDFAAMDAMDYPTMEDLYALCEKEYREYAKGEKQLFTEEMLREVCLGIHSMCVGSESKYFNGYTNIRDSKFLCFGIKNLMNTNERLKNAILFMILNYMNNALIAGGNTVASVDELHLFLSNMTAISYIRNAMKRVRKRGSIMILASQNIEDFLLPSYKEFTKPLFSIPTHHFLFHPGKINPQEFMDTLQLDEAEYDLISSPANGVCLYRCGNERYLCQVKASEYKRTILEGKE